MNKSTNYFEEVYLGKKNDKVCTSDNKRLIKLLSAKAFNRAGDSVRADMKIFRPKKKSTDNNSSSLHLLLDKFQ